MFATQAQYSPHAVAQARPDERALFIRRTYGHLAGAILAFIAIEALLLQSPGVEAIVHKMIGGRWSWLIVLGAFMGVSWLADSWARSDTSPGMQYLGLSLYVVAESIIFLPILYIASSYYPGVIMQAGIVTGLLFCGLTAVVVTTRADFSFMRGALTIAGFVAMGLIVASIVMQFNLGLLFSGVMVVFAGGSILYTTSNIMRHYRTDQHVAASLSLFAGVALLFWYILQIIMSFSGRD